MQVVLEYEILNNSDEDLYLYFVFPPNILESLISEVNVQQIPADSETNSVAVITIKKEMPEETMKAILNEQLPIVEQAIVGEIVDVKK